MAEISILTVAPKKNEPHFQPFVRIYLSSHSVDNDGRSLMSPQLMTEKEVDETINYLIEQLEKARKKAKSELIKANTER